MPTGRVIDNGALTDVTVAVDPIGGIDHQYVKLEWGPDGTATQATTANPIPVREYSAASAASSANVTSVAAAVADTELRAANASRQHLSVFNDSTANLYLKWGPGASATSFTVKLVGGAFYELPQGKLGPYTGAVYGYWDSATGSARVTEA